LKLKNSLITINYGGVAISTPVSNSITSNTWHNIRIEFIGGIFKILFDASLITTFRDTVTSRNLSGTLIGIGGYCGNYTPAIHSVKNIKINPNYGNVLACSDQINSSLYIGGSLGINTNPGSYQLNVTGSTNLTGNLNVTGSLSASTVTSNGIFGFMYQTATQSIATATTTQIIGTFTSLVGINSLSNNFVVVVAGTYQITGSVIFIDNGAVVSSAYVREVLLMKNGLTTITESHGDIIGLAANSGAQTTIQINTISHFSIGDVIGMLVYQTSGLAMNIKGGITGSETFSYMTMNLIATP